MNLHSVVYLVLVEAEFNLSGVIYDLEASYSRIAVMGADDYPYRAIYLDYLADTIGDQIYEGYGAFDHDIFITLFDEIADSYGPSFSNIANLI